ncbi:MAG: hypothetical protein PHF24_04180 [Syntrophomonas sp.]|nr:hypothetical protein [Syntrophomonas sp.]
MEKPKYLDAIKSTQDVDSPDFGYYNKYYIIMCDYLTNFINISIQYE